VPATKNPRYKIVNFSRHSLHDVLPLKVFQIPVHPLTRKEIANRAMVVFSRKWGMCKTRRRRSPDNAEGVR
jgi:hypothetical protein